MPGRGPAKGTRTRGASGSGWRLVFCHFFPTGPRSPRRPLTPRGLTPRTRWGPGPGQKSACGSFLLQRPSGEPARLWGSALLCSALGSGACVVFGEASSPYIGPNHAHLEFPEGVATAPQNGAKRGGSRGVTCDPHPHPREGEWSAVLASSETQLGRL